MTRWVRFVVTVLRSMLRPRLRVDQESRLTFRVWPTDADLSLMNHACYLTIMEQGRIDFIMRTGILRLMLRHHWSALLGSITVQYRSPLRRFQRFQLRTRVVCWDDKWIFLEHQISRESRIVAGGLAKIAFLAREGRIAPAEALRAFGVTVASPPVAAMVRSLQDGEREMHERVQAWPALEWSREA
jgi:acyl-CoA thioesterase FadM